jgi:hypothetical protein
MSRLKITCAALALIVLGALSYCFFRSASADHDAQPASVTSSRSTTDQGGTLVAKQPSDSTSAHNAGSVKPPEIADDRITSKFLIAKKCYYARMGIRQFQENADCQQLASSQATARAYAECLKTWDEKQATITRFQRQIADVHCPEDADLVKNYYDSTKQAAQHGDVNAQLCYLQSSFTEFDARSQHYTDKDVADYKASSPVYIQQAFQRGDWRVVQLLSNDRHGGITGLAIGIPDIGTTRTIFKMLTLLRLGAIGDYANQLDSQIDMLVRPDEKANPELPQSVMDEDKAWAQETYSKYFSSSPRLKETPFPCDTATPNP